MIFSEIFSNSYYSTALLLFGVLVLLVIGKIYFNGGKCNLQKNLEGKVIIITGANSGIGFASAVVLARLGATIIIGCRSIERGTKAVADIKEQSKKSNVEFIQLDLADTGSIRNFVKEFKSRHKRLDILINNAGVMGMVKREETKDKYEMTIGVNHLGHFLLTHLLIDTLKASAPARIINVSSIIHFLGKIKWSDFMHEKSYNHWSAYSQSKLANILITKKLARTYEKDQIKTVCLHPGVIKSEIIRYYMSNMVKKAIVFLGQWIYWYFSKNALQGAQTTLYCALEDYDKLVNGGYYTDCSLARESKAARSIEDADRLWIESYRLLKLEGSL